jgi:hypothetical protein
MTLDHIDNIVLNSHFSDFKNNHSVKVLLEGIFMTYNSMKSIENDFKNNESASLVFRPAMTQTDTQSLNLMHWYSISLMNFVQCCGLVKYINQNRISMSRIYGDKKEIQKLKKFQIEYRNSIPEIKSIEHFRNKAAAHLAITDPKPYDNLATLFESFSLIPSIENGIYYVGGITRGVGEETSSFSKNKWSLTQNFESLIPRYFIDYFK